jgi:hypothetical protein
MKSKDYDNIVVHLKIMNINDNGDFFSGISSIG